MAGDKDNPIDIHPFDVFKIMHDKNLGKEPWFWERDWEEFPQDILKIDGQFYHQTTEVPASEEAKKLVM
jgi:hypothetical protein